MRDGLRRVILLGIALYSSAALAEKPEATENHATASAVGSADSASPATAQAQPAAQAQPTSTAPSAAKTVGAAAERFPAEYEIQLRIGMQELRAGRLNEARSRFLFAHKAYETARTLWGLGMVAYEMQDYPAAMSYLDAALASQVKPIPVARREKVKRDLEIARGYIARFQVTTQPANATLFVDNTQLRPSPDGAIVLGVGPHELEARAEGFMASKRRLNVVGGQQGEVKFTLVPLQAGDDGEVYEEWWFWTSVGGAVAAALVAGVLVANAEPDVIDAAGGTTRVVIPVSAD